MSSPERDFLQGILNSSPSSAKRWAAGAGNAVVLFAVLMLLFFGGWWVVAWLARTTISMDIGLRSSAALWVIALGVSGCALGAAVSSVRWARGWHDVRPRLRADLEGGQVVEELYQFTAAKRFQEPEHGGLFYFLLTTDEKVLVLYDAESQNLGAAGEDPLGSPFKAYTRLSMVRAPNTGYVINQRFSGELLDAGEPREMRLPPRQWPEPDMFCQIPWQKLEERLSK